MLKFLLPVAIACFPLAGCFQQPVQSNGVRQHLSSKIVKDLGNSKSITSINPNATQALQVSVAEGNELAGTSISVAPGSLAIAVNVVIEEGSNFADSSLTSEVNLASDVTITNAGSGVIVRPSEAAELAKPLELSLPLPATLGARLAGTQYAVYFRHFDPPSKKLITGVKIVDNVDVKLVRDDKSQLDLVRLTGYFGIYWVVALSREVQKEEVPQAKISEEPVVNKANTIVIAAAGIIKESEIVKTQALPEFVWPKPILSFDPNNRRVELATSASIDFEVKDCRTDLCESANDLMGVSIGTQNFSATTYDLQKTTAHSLLGRFRCFDKLGRVSLSPWSDSVAINALTVVSVKAVESSLADGVYTTGSLIPISVSFSDVVKVEGLPALELGTGAIRQKAIYQSGSGTDKILFHYTVLAGDESSDLSYVTTSSLLLDSKSSIKDRFGVAANLTLPAPGDARSLGGQKAIAIDALSPSAPSSVGFASSNTNTTNLTLAWSSGTDSNFKQHNVKLCTAHDCSSSCAAALSTQSSSIALSANSESTYYGCVQTEDLGGNVSAWVPSLSSVSIDLTPPAATIVGVPTGTSNASSLNMTIAGAGVTEYKYKVRQTATTACSNSTGYSSAAPIATAITHSLSAFADGAMEICVIGRDAVGNWQAEASATTASWTKDTTAPSATVSGDPTGTNNTSTLNVTIAGAGVSHYKYKIREAADTACSNSTGYSGQVAVATPISNSISSLGDGTIELCVIGRDAAGNWQAEASATAVNWTKNSVAPTATISGQPTSTNNTTTLNVTIAGAGVSHYKYKVRDTTVSACSNVTGYSAEAAVATPISSSISSLADGTIELCVIGRNSTGNWQTEASATTVSWTKDTAAPTATISNEPTGTNNTTTLNVAIAGTGVSHYKYKIRESASAACSNSTGYIAETPVATPISSSLSGLGDGTLELCVIGRDAAGNWQAEASATAVSWTKDSAAPTASISGAPASTNNTTTLNVTIAGSGVSHYKYKIREAADIACSNAIGYSAETAVATPISSSISSLADGTIELCVIGRDAAGNWQAEASAATASWTKDATPPAASLSGEPSGSSNATSLDITVAGAGVTQYRYKIREAADTACSNSSDYSTATAVATHITDSISAKADGAIEVCVIGKDASGNWQLEGNAISASWTKDTTAPTAATANQPTGTSSTTTLNVTIAGTGVSHYKYKIREAADTACSNSTGYSGQIAVATPISNSISALADGAIELCVIGRDTAGNWQAEASATAVSWTKDNAAVSASISGTPTASSNATILNITIAGVGITHYKYKIRESADTPCSNATGYSTETAVASAITDSISALADGTIQVCVIGRDASSNWQAQASATTVSWTKDTVAPTVSAGMDLLANSSIAINATASDSGSGIAGYAWTKESGSGTVNFSTASSEDSDVSASVDGTFVLRLTVNDQAGNSAYDDLILEWDTTAPSLPTSVGFGSAYSASTSLSLSWSNSSDTHFSTHNIKLCASNDCSTACLSESTDAASPGTLSGVNGSSYYACVRGEDTLGNTSAWVASVATTTVDTTAPTSTSLTINSGMGFTTSTSVTLTLNATGANEMYVTNTASCASGGSWEAYSTSKAWTLGQSNATATAYVKYRDLAGNESACVSDTIIHDSFVPTALSVSINAGASTTNSTSVNLTLGAADAHAIEIYVTNTSGCASGGSWEAFTSSKAWTLGQTGGTATVYVRFRDPAGNTSSCVNDTITHLAGAPTSPLISIEAGASTVSGTTVTLALSATDATEMYVSNDPSCSAGGSWETYASSKSWVISVNQARNATVYAKYRNATMQESSCVNDSILVQSPSILTNGDFETGDVTGWSNTVAGKWVVDNTNVNMGTYSAHTNAVANSSTACFTQTVDLTAATEDHVVDFNWSYGTQAAGDFADFMIDATTKLSLSGLSSGWTSHSVLVPMGAARLLKWCYRKNSTGIANGDYVGLDEIRVGAPILLPPSQVSSVGSNGTVALTITAPAAPPAGYLVLRGTSAVNFTPVNGTVYNAGAQGAYQVIYRGISPTPSDAGLTNGTTYHYAVYSYDDSDNYSLAASTTGLPWGAYTPTALTATPGTGQVALSWTVPGGGAQSGYLVVMQSGSDVAFTPTNGTTYAVGAVSGGTAIFKGAGLSYTKTGLTVATNYYFKVWSYDSSNRYSLLYAGASAMPL